MRRFVIPAGWIDDEPKKAVPKQDQKPAPPPVDAESKSDADSDPSEPPLPESKPTKKPGRL